MHRTLKAVFLTGYVEVAESLGLEPYEILNGANIDPRWLDEPQHSLSLGSIVRVFEDSARHSGHDDFGLILARHRTFSSIGPVALLLQHEPTLRDFLNAVIKYRTVLEEAILISVDEVGSVATIRWELMSVYSSVQLMDYILAASRTILGEASDGAWRPSVAHFRRSVPKRIRSFERHFGCRLEFNDGFDGLTCPLSALDIKIPSADPALASHARQLLDMKPELRTDPPVTDYVRNAVRLAVHGGPPTLDRVAGTLGVSARSVQRRLASEGQSFESILNETRRELALLHIETSDRSITEIAADTGFSSLSSFERWFKAQFATSPMRWRKGHCGDERRTSLATSSTR